VLELIFLESFLEIPAELLTTIIPIPYQCLFVCKNNHKIRMLQLITLLGDDLCREGDPMLNGNGLKESDQFCSPRGAHVGGFFSVNPDVQSVWSFNEKETT
jgi:hypothetical protein